MNTILPVFLIGVSVCWYGMRAIDLLKLSSPSRLQKLLCIIFIWWSVSTFKDLAIYIPGTDTDVVLDHIFYIDGCGAVTFALFLIELTSPGWVRTRRVLLLSAPFLLFLLLHFLANSDLLHTVFTVFFVVFAWSAVLYAMYKSRKYRKAIQETYSNLDDVDISWIWKIIAVFIVCQHVWWAVSDSFDVLADSFYYVSSLVCWSLVMLGVNRMRALRLPDYPGYDGMQADSEPETAETLNTRKRTSGLEGRLEKLMEDEELYTNPDLTLSNLVDRLGTNRTYLSEYISTELGTTFYDYVNRLRIERKVIPMLLKGNNNYSLEFIAEQAGFKSLTTFRRAFKKLTGLLPSEYMRLNSGS